MEGMIIPPLAYSQFDSSDQQLLAAYFDALKQFQKRIMETGILGYDYIKPSSSEDIDWPNAGRSCRSYDEWYRREGKYYHLFSICI